MMLWSGWRQTQVAPGPSVLLGPNIESSTIFQTQTYGVATLVYNIGFGSARPRCCPGLVVAKLIMLGHDALSSLIVARSG
jgi:hypothetical protein